MRTTTALATALALALPALPAGAAPRAALGQAVAQAPDSAAARPVQGALTLEARQLQGAEAIVVAGSAPAGATVTITLLALVSPDVPTILVSRHDVATDSSGRFGAVIPIASAYERGTILQIVADAAGASAQARLTTGAPNAGVSVPLTTNY